MRRILVSLLALALAASCNDKGDPNLPPYAVYRWSNGSYEEIGEEAPAG